jgi:hypothetical protein
MVESTLTVNASLKVDSYESTLEYLSRVVATIREYGWISKKSAEARMCASTADMVEIGRVKPTEDDKAEASRVLMWAEALGDHSDLNDYLSNVHVACKQGYVDTKTKGIVASAVSAYRRDTAEVTESATSAHVGKVGDRLILNVVVTRVTESNGYYGITTIVSMRDDTGNEFVWFASGEKTYKVGDKLQGKGAVKAHGEFRGIKQTTLTRCKLLVVDPTRIPGF